MVLATVCAGLQPQSVNSDELLLDALAAAIGALGAKVRMDQFTDYEISGLLVTVGNMGHRKAGGGWVERGRRHARAQPLTWDGTPSPFNIRPANLRSKSVAADWLRAGKQGSLTWLRNGREIGEIQSDRPPLRLKRSSPLLGTKISG